MRDGETQIKLETLVHDVVGDVNFDTACLLKTKYVSHIF